MKSFDPIKASLLTHQDCVQADLKRFWDFSISCTFECRYKGQLVCCSRTWGAFTMESLKELSLETILAGGVVLSQQGVTI